ncbi:MAG: hypothetical protein CSB46_10780 [Micrococcales bacterium]|nr:MAG: hypothetical protein CSB46_10780 [Micrococcales bacterium]
MLFGFALGYRMQPSTLAAHNAPIRRDLVTASTAAASDASLLNRTVARPAHPSLDRLLRIHRSRVAGQERAARSQRPVAVVDSATAAARQKSRRDPVFRQRIGTR